MLRIGEGGRHCLYVGKPAFKGSGCDAGALVQRCHHHERLDRGIINVLVPTYIREPTALAELQDS